MPGIFISYRRDESAGHAGRLYADLSRRFESVFIDIHALKPGVNFVQAIKDVLDSCAVLIALLGRQWVSMI
jgi:hypothetical protein